MSSEIKVTNIKHESSGSNNLVLGSDGNVSITNTLSAGTIGSGVNIADGASPHGWQHIGTKHYNTDTSPTDTKYFPLVNEAGSTLTVSSDFSVYKIYFQLSNSSGVKDLRFRFMTGASTYYTSANYTYYIDKKEQGGGTGNYSNSNADDKLFLFTDVNQNAGSRGVHGEITIFNVYASASDTPTIDGNQYDSTRNEGYRPYGYFKVVGNNYGTNDQLLFGGFKINGNVYFTGFTFYYEDNASMYQGSWHSIYGLKLA